LLDFKAEEDKVHIPQSSGVKMHFSLIDSHFSGRGRGTGAPCQSIFVCLLEVGTGVESRPFVYQSAPSLSKKIEIPFA